jgi:hypothetical protein
MEGRDCRSTSPSDPFGNANAATACHSSTTNARLEHPVYNVDIGIVSS